MTVKDAYKLIMRVPGINRKFLIVCLDLGDQYAFLFSDEPPKEGDVIIGGGYDTVNKKTGEIGRISSNLDTIEQLSAGRKVDISGLK